MKMTLVAAAILTAALSGAPAQAQSGKASECAVQADLFQSVADLRLAGESKAKALETTRAQLTDASRKYESAVLPMVEYIYGLEDQHLRLDLSATYVEQCMAAQ